MNTHWKWATPCPLTSTFDHHGRAPVVLDFASPGALAPQGLLLPTQEGGSWPQMAPASLSCLCRKKAGAPSSLGLWLGGCGQGKLRAGRGLRSSPAVQSLPAFCCLRLLMSPSNL